ncbi:aldo/keto reductase family oxidoreductase [Enterococcus durans]|uniref:Aldo/keto reductase family oxidoreductase n=1 Tax=Enterococcus durans TaxID=53345 RepID=A0A5N0YZG3_9ENTE|nr:MULTISPECIES: aldo/keto reductase [Enterococcus]KAA9177360.1 aldo/keto reductase family oxidoreductase [Enterococcus durans]KAA9186857.1 aldo/keto reductase family oxidoreductase [Enterococcus durans]KAA9187190.1 aldo/keto reductase family oxidoreductase [Enterococcus durans]KAA9192839.1 aldo/keto reductase family oxidoreductase [Enterococcus durans]KAA9195202.1 aldo/keto reductase family oxidoreductase [Enterococcus durans]
MKQIQLGASTQMVSSVILGCMRINGAKDPVKVIETAYDNGINFFDHADIYGGGECESIFADALAKTSLKREDLFIQTKCGIVPGVMFDFSKKHIIESVEGSLQRLNMDYVDVLLLHRPDTLVDPSEVAEAFDELEKSGKVRHFGVSNQKPMQIDLLKKYVKQPLLANQLQFGLKHSGMIDQGIHVNMTDDGSVDHDGSVLDYSRLNDMTIQAWSPYQYGFFEGVFIGNEKFPELNQVLDNLAEKYGTTPTGLAAAWILRHPANMQVIAGTMNPGRIEEIAKASEIQLTREDWYELYRAAGNILP